ncbi:MAG TPA: hypothetical protein VNZ52_10150 [Candidatus Thermoplasmatota archaeon]|nr:hypothetical protein [Candidatus Thermoplasmatota archaeon]
MRPALVLLATLLTLLAGCTSGPRDVRTDEGGNNTTALVGVAATDPFPCDPGYPGVRWSGNAPPDGVFREGEEAVAAALLEALDDAPSEEEGTGGENSATYATREGGLLRVDNATGEPVWSYVVERNVRLRNETLAERFVRALLNRTGVTSTEEALVEAREAGEGLTATARQRFENRSLPTALQLAVGSDRLLLTLRPWYDLSEAEANLSAARAGEVARRFIECEREEDPRLEGLGEFVRAEGGGFAVRHQSLVRVTMVTFDAAEAGSCAGSEAFMVEVDAVTGGVHGWRPPRCLE